MDINERINAATYFLKGYNMRNATIGIILGSGLGDFAENLTDCIAINYKDIPGFPTSTVVGHGGEMYLGYFKGIPIMLMSGRFHYYEGYDQKEVTMPIRIMKNLGINTLIITNAAGGINLEYSSGALMLISDHINLSGSNPLIGPNMEEYGTRFPDMSDTYSEKLRTSLMDMALTNNIDLKEGIYAMMSGPSFETPAEIRYLRAIGADAVGMSTVPEAIVASHCNIKVIGISCITNMAAGISKQKLTHKEVFETAQRVKNDFAKIVDFAILISSKNEG